ncbi:MAG: hypothetical protein R3F20_13480 [Planctomycetota bacterium]
MSRTIAFITAPNPRLKNTGMVSVDLASRRIARLLPAGVEARWYTSAPPTAPEIETVARHRELEFRPADLLASREEIRDAAAVVLWGDFLQARHYLRDDAAVRILERGAAADPAAAVAAAYDALLLRDAPTELRRRAILFGGTLLHEDGSARLDVDYRAAFEDLVRHAAGAWMRDPISAGRVARLRPEDGARGRGVDAALLLEESDLAGLPTGPWLADLEAGARIGVFVGQRTRVPGGLPRFVRELAAATGAAPEWFPWFDRRPRWSRDLVAYRMRRGLERRGAAGAPLLGDLFGALRRYRFIVTDTYHLALNAWRAGTPTICLGAVRNWDARGSSRTLADVKKQVFFLDHDLADFHLSAVDLGRREGEDRVARILELDRAGLPATATRQLREEARRVESDLLALLEILLGEADRAPRAADAAAG